MSFTYIIKKFSFNSLYTKNIDTKPSKIQGKKKPSTLTHVL